MHELEIVDEHEIDAAELLLEAAQLGVHLGDGDDGRVVDVEIEAVQLARGGHQAALFGFRLLAEADAADIDAGFRREEAMDELVVGHLNREDGDARVLGDRRVAGEVEEDGRLADARTGGADDEVGALEAAEQGIEVHEAGADGADRRRIDVVDARLFPELIEQDAERDEVAHAL